jgi:hypothetical protein
MDTPAQSKIVIFTQCTQAQGPSSTLQFWVFTVHKPNPNWVSQKSKAQLKWAPATSKDGSDYDPPSPVTDS